jgi:hypothetical protein
MPPANITKNTVAKVIGASMENAVRMVMVEKNTARMTQHTDRVCGNILLP